MDYGTLTSVMRDAAVEAGERIMAIRRSGKLDSRLKPDSSPVTAADEAADEIIHERMGAAFPDLAIVSEERTGAGAQQPDFASSLLIVDPLDGTRDFADGGDDFTVNIALVESGEPTRGVVHAPAIRRTFWTDADGRAFEAAGGDGRDGSATPRRIAVCKPDKSALRAVVSKARRCPATDECLARYGVAETRGVGSSLKLCLVAAGEADLYPRIGRTMEWDTAAGHAVLRCAGGDVVRLDDGRPLAYGKPGLENPSFIALAPGVEAR